MIYQISLHGSAYDARGKDWNTVEEETGCIRDTQWRDPILDRPLLVTEFGCAVSHLRVWQKIAGSNRNGIILEEDAVYDSIDPSAVDTLLKEHDSVWLGYRLNTLGYWYNCHAYAIRPETAKRLIDGYKDAIIPVDEWVPAKLKGQSNFFFTPEVVTQIPREVRPSTIEEEKNVGEFHIVTVATEPEKMWALEQSAKKFGVKVTNLGENHPWRDPMTGLSGMPKIQLVNEYLATVHEDDIVLFMDGYDTFFADSPEVILERFYHMEADIVFGAESEHWPLVDDEFMRDKWPETGTPYRYLNSGLYIGKAKALHAFIVQSAPSTSYDEKDDQLFCQIRYLGSGAVEGDLDWKHERQLERFPFTVKLDVEAYIFQNHEPDIRIVEGQLWNDKTSCCGCIYHGNGGEDAKAFFVTMAEKFGFIPEAEVVSSPYYLTLDYEEVAPDILCTDFLSEKQCEYLIEKSSSLGNWSELEGDKFPAQEIRLKQLGLWHEYARLWHEKLGKICEKHWHPEAYLGLRDAFTMRYSMDTQTELGLHTDASLFTGSVKLNNNYAGAELVFPRQEFTNKDVKVGQCILFPSMVTHGHKVLPLRGGKKYSLTMWTCRYEGDSN